MADHLRSSLCENALMMAIQHRAPPPGLVHYSDRGVQYACGPYRKILDRYGIQASMVHTVGNFWRYERTHWMPIDDAWLRLMVHEYDGSGYLGSRGEKSKVKLGKPRIDSIINEL